MCSKCTNTFFLSLRKIERQKNLLSAYNTPLWIVLCSEEGRYNVGEVVGDGTRKEGLEK